MGELTLTNSNVANEIALTSFSEDEVKHILAIKDSINVDDEQAIMDVGSEVSKEISGLNKSVLDTIKAKDIPEIESILPQLTQAFDEVDGSMLVSKRRGLFDKFFKQNRVEEFIKKFETAEEVVADIQKNLERVEIELRKDMAMEDALAQKNMKCIRDLEANIVALKLKINEMVDSIKEHESKADSKDIVEMQLIAEEKDKVESLDKQVYWLSQQRLLAIQALPLLRNLKNNNRDMVRQITLTLQQSIPAWEQRIIIAFHIHRQQGALRIERAVHDMTNQLVKQNSELLKQNSIEIAKAVESGMIDIETFRSANRDIIETSKRLAEIKDEAIKSRAESLKEYRDITLQLVESEKRNMLGLVSKKVGEISG